MTTYTYPSDLIYVPASVEWKLAPNVGMFTSPFSGQVQTTEMPGARWIAVLNFVPHRNDDRAAVEAWFTRLRGPANRIALWHPVRPAPRGTLQANTTTAATAAYGATSISITATTGLTLLAGDMIGILLADTSTQLVQIVQDATSSAGAIAAAFSPPLRWSVANGATVTVVKPTATFILMDSPRIPYQPVVSPGFSVELMEVF